jgi:hypothetical protein
MVNSLQETYRKKFSLPLVKAARKFLWAFSLYISVRNKNSKNRTFIQFAFQPDGAMHQFKITGYDMQAQPGALDIECIFSPKKPFKQMLPVFL